MPYKKMLVLKSTNNLTQAIIDYLNMEGHKAFRVNNEGQFEEANRSTYNYDKISHHVGPLKAWGFIIGRFRKSNTEKGISDVMSILAPKGIFMAVEVKFGDDKQSPEQKKWQEEVIAAGGEYYIAKEFDQFLEYYSLIKYKHNL